MDDGIKNSSKDTNSKPKSKKPKKETHQKILHRERKIITAPIFVFPIIMTLIFLLSVIFIDFTYGIFVSVVIIPLLIYSMVHQEKLSIKSKKRSKLKSKRSEVKSKRSSETYFKKVGHENALIRYHNLSKYLRYYLVTIIIILAVASLSIYLINLDDENKRNAYKDALVEYEQTRENLAAMDETETKAELKKQIRLMGDYTLQNKVLEQEIMKIKNTLTKSELELTYEERSEIQYNASVIVNQLTPEEIQSAVLNDIESMTPFEIRIALEHEVDRLRPYSFSSGFNLKWQQNFLISSIFTIGMMFVSLFFVKMSLTKKKDFYYYLALSCFIIYKKFKNLEQEEKRNYVNWGLDYYDSYIKTNHKKRIDKLELIQSHIITQSSKSIDEIAEEILKKLKSKDRFELFQNLGEIIGKTNLNISLIHDPLFARMRDHISLIVVSVPIITVIITIINNYVK